MLRFFTGEDLADYMAAGDPLAQYLGRVDSVGERWLRESPAKRMIAWELYEGLLTSSGRWILDVGACHTSLQHELADRHSYTDCDLGEHDGFRSGSLDWRDLPTRPYDVIVANDVFPNVDQGLQAFLTRFYGSGELRMSLTIYADKFYRARRVDGEELLTVQAWDWPQTRRVLVDRGIRIGEAQHAPARSLFRNGRQVALLTC